MKPLYDFQQEINRLFIAGSKFAQGDPRLTKYVPIFNQLGEKAPVFKKLAQDTDELTRTASDESADKLLGLGTLLYSVLYTQGNTIEEDAEIKPLEPLVPLANINTSASYLKLSPIIKALTTTKSGRMDVVEEGFHCGVFNDFRTYEYVNRALGDKYAELADFIEQTVVPSTDVKMLPLLVATFSYEGRPEDIRRFRLLDRLKYPDLQKMITKILETSPLSLQVEAIKALGNDVVNQPLVISLAADKHKSVREAAYQALARYNTPESAARLTEVFLKNKNKSNIDGIVEALKLFSGFLPAVFDKVHADFEAFAALDKDVNMKTLAPLYETLCTEMNIIYGKTDERILRFFEEILSHQEFNTVVSSWKTFLGYNNGPMIGSDIAQNLVKLGQPGIETFERLACNVEVMKNWGATILPYYFDACVSVYTPEVLYDTFASHYKNKRLKSYTMISSWKQYWKFDPFSYSYWCAMPDPKFVDAKIDKRWFDLFLDRSDETIYFAITYDPKNKKIKNVIGNRLDEAVKNRKIPDDLMFFIEKAAEAEVPDFQNMVLKIFENGKNIVRYDGYTHLKESPALKFFPKSYEGRFRKLATMTNVDVLNKIADIVSKN